MRFVIKRLLHCNGPTPADKASRTLFHPIAIAPASQVNAAALIGLTGWAAEGVLDRARTGSFTRFPGFAPAMQDAAPSADHFANMNRALIDMLLQSGDDGFVNTTIVLFPAWPCAWDVDFKLWGPLNTSVELSYSGATGALSTFIVTPSERAAAVKFAGCAVAPPLAE